MGLLKHLLFWPVTGPSFLARFAVEKVQDTVRSELTDDERVKEELLALQMELELGEIEDEEYLAREVELMRQLREVRQWREEFGMSVTGGAVRVAAEDREGAAEPTSPGADSGAPDGIASAEDVEIEVDRERNSSGG